MKEALAKGTFLETMFSYCQNSIRLDARTFEPMDIEDMIRTISKAGYMVKKEFQEGCG